jgi:MFS family permease
LVSFHGCRKTKACPLSLFTRPFVLLCLAMFLGYANQWIFMPAIPLYVDSLGGSAFVAGLALLAFSVPSFTVRPFVGRVADRWNAAGVLAIGLALLAAGSLVLLVPFLAMVFVAGVVRGLGWAGLNIGGYVTLATAAPPQRRGEAAGWYTSATASASVVFPALALWLLDGHGGFQVVFLLSVLAALAGLPIALVLARKKPRTQAAKPAEDPGWGGLIERGVLVATGVNLCSTLAMPAVMAFLPLYARSLGIEHVGLFYVLAGITSIVARPALGKRSDAMGRGPAIGIGLASQLIGLLLIAFAQALPQILAGGFFVALGSAMIGSTTTALAMDLSNPQSRGRGMATFSISYQIGAGVGAIISGALADAFGLRAMYVGSIAITVAGLGILAGAWKLLPKPGKTVPDGASQMNRPR